MILMWLLEIIAVLSDVHFLASGYFNAFCVLLRNFVRLNSIEVLVLLDWCS